MILTVVAAVWIAASIVTAPLFGRGIRGPVALAPVIALFPPAAPAGEETGRRGLPARLSPRAGLATSRNWKRFRRDLASYGWLTGLVVAVVLVYVLSLLQGLTPTTAIR